MIGYVQPSARSLLGGLMGRLRGFGGTAVHNPGTPVATSVSINPASATIALGKTQQFVATILDQFGNPFTVGGGAAAAWETNNAAIATVTVGGLATGTGYGSTSLLYQITGSVNLSNTAGVVIQQPTALAMITQPAGATTGSAFTTQPVVELRDGSGNPDAESGRTVTVSIVAGSGTLSGPPSVATDGSGRAVFANLVITGSGAHTLTFACPGLTGVSSASFSVTAEGGFITQPLINRYFNSDEPGGDGSDPGVLFADNGARRYSDGHTEYWWYKKNFDDAANQNGPIGSAGWIAQTSGWGGTIYNPIVNGGTAGPGTGYRGRGQAFDSGSLPGGGGPGQGQMADHTFAGEQALSEAWFRYYLHPLSNYVGGHEKMLDFVTGGLSSAQILALAYNYFGSDQIDMLPYRFQDFGLNPPGPGNTSWIGQNVGSPITMIPGHWYYVEYHVRLNTPGSFDGVYERWMDDLGTNGLSIPSTPTLRARHTGVKFRGAGDNDLITGAWIENWGNASSAGNLHYHYCMARKDRACGLLPAA